MFRWRMLQYISISVLIVVSPALAHAIGWIDVTVIDAPGYYTNSDGASVYLPNAKRYDYTWGGTPVLSEAGAEAVLKEWFPNTWAELSSGALPYGSAYSILEGITGYGTNWWDGPKGIELQFLSPVSIVDAPVGWEAPWSLSGYGGSQTSWDPWGAFIPGFSGKESLSRTNFWLVTSDYIEGQVVTANMGWQFSYTWGNVGLSNVHELEPGSLFDQRFGYGFSGGPQLVRSAIPEPSSLLLVMSGLLLGVGRMIRHRR